MNSISDLGLQANCLIAFISRSMRRHHHNTKTDIVVPVVRVVVVAIRTTHVPLIIVERAAAQHTDDVFGLPRQNALALKLYAASLFKPTAQQFSRFFHHQGYMFVLSFVK